MKILHLAVKNYKSFPSLDAKGLSGINMVYGYNNSGKSNLLRFLDICFRAKRSASGDDSTGDYWYGLVEGMPYLYNDSSKPIQFDVTVELQLKDFDSIPSADRDIILKYVDNRRTTYTLAIHGKISRLSFEDSEISLESVSLNSKNIFSIILGGETYFEGAPVDTVPTGSGYGLFTSVMRTMNNKVVLLDNNRYFGREFIGDTSGEGMKATHIELTPQNYKRWLFNLFMNPEYYDQFQELTQFVKRFKITNFGPAGGRNIQLEGCEANSPISSMNVGFSQSNDQLEVMLENGIHKRFPLTNFGTGIQQILYILSRIFMSDARIILLEELELNLSPRYQSELLQMLRGLQPATVEQCIFTTHSKYFTKKTDFSIYEVKIDAMGTSTVERVKKPRKDFFDRNELE